jgi:hypothetical protein
VVFDVLHQGYVLDLLGEKHHLQEYYKIFEARVAFDGLHQGYVLDLLAEKHQHHHPYDNYLKA